jgi:hypothetical protein
LRTFVGAVVLTGGWATAGGCTTGGGFIGSGPGG